ncbi:MAG TPA: hypothetical protein VJQ55_17210, partial [Candidatus Binatia bacterium]|nr:hypothetical protein [Candidatus Binatia bacterium]
MKPVKETEIVEKAAPIATLIFGVTAAAFFAAWLYALYHYVWTASRQFDSAWAIIFFICLPPLFALFALGAARLRPSPRVSAAVLWSSTVVSLYALEILLAFWPLLPGNTSDVSPNERRQLAARFGVTFDARAAIEVLSAMQARGVDAVPAVSPAVLLEEQAGGFLKSAIRSDGTEVLPLAGVSNKATVLCNETGTYVVYPSDEHGFHNPRGLWRSGRIDVAVVGDSFVHGFCVPSQQNFVA